MACQDHIQGVFNSNIAGPFLMTHDQASLRRYGPSIRLITTIITRSPPGVAAAHPNAATLEPVYTLLLIVSRLSIMDLVKAGSFCSQSRSPNTTTPRSLIIITTLTPCFRAFEYTPRFLQ